MLVCGEPPLPPCPPAVRVTPLPRLSQSGYDRLLWSCDLNLVRGEDSFVRAQWAGKPMLWQLYPQQDGAHEAKLEAYLQRRGLAAPQRAGWRAWNGLCDPTVLAAALDSGAAAAAEALAWREQLQAGTGARRPAAALGRGAARLESRALRPGPSLLPRLRNAAHPFRKRLSGASTP